MKALAPLFCSLLACGRVGYDSSGAAGDASVSGADTGAAGDSMADGGSGAAGDGGAESADGGEPASSDLCSPPAVTDSCGNVAVSLDTGSDFMLEIESGGLGNNHEGTCVGSATEDFTVLVRACEPGYYGFEVVSGSGAGFYPMVGQCSSPSACLAGGLLGASYFGEFAQDQVMAWVFEDAAVTLRVRHQQ